MIENVEKLRVWSHRYDNAWIQDDGSIMFTAGGGFFSDGKENYGESIRSMIDAIEEEIAERYIELPLDADGVPIRAGDLIEFGEKGERLEVTHLGWTRHGDPTIAYRRPNGTLDCSCIGTECRHVKQRTIEDVLMDAGVSVAAISDVAAEIRELLGVGE